MNDPLIQQLLSTSGPPEPNSLRTPEHAASNSTDHGRVVVPRAGFCLKSRTSSGEKVFVNVCQSEHIPAPPAVSDEELTEIVSNGHWDKFRLQLACGPPHTEADKSGGEATAYDVIVHPNVISRCDTSTTFYSFTTEFVLQNIETKRDLLLSRPATRLKRRLSVGPLTPQTIRSKPIPKIESNFKEMKSVPTHSIVYEPTEKSPEFLIITINLPKLKTIKECDLFLGSSAIEFHADEYYESLYLSFPHLRFDSNSSGAQFDRKTRQITLTLSVSP